ncbi:MAG: hypothetical protein JOZ19_03160 [Rubrobacter sp.]|nr:hypothetical protein [Rubrobacter sp.]
MLVEFDGYAAISFDCYGTLIDWESSIFSGLQPVLQNHGTEASDEEILKLHAQTKHKLQANSTRGNYVNYRHVLVEGQRGEQEMGFRT